MRPRHTRLVEALDSATPFVGPETLERRTGRPIELRLGANESPFGPSSSAIAAMQAQAQSAQFYGDPEGLLLRTELATLLGIGPENIVLGAGIDELLGQCCRIFVEPGQTVITTLGSYPTFEYGAAGCGADIVAIPYKSEAADLRGLAHAARESGARLIYLANPDNPSGAWHDPAAVSDLIESLPTSCVLLLDEAYVEFAPASLPFDCNDARVIRVRTFSKAHGMAGLRVAYAIAHEEHCVGFNKIRFHFGVNSVAQAGAIASLRALEHIDDVIRETEIGREEMSIRFLKLGMRPLSSHTNFLTVDVGGKLRAEAILLALLQKGVFIRKPSRPPLDGCIRVTIGRPEQRCLFFDALDQVLREL